MRRKSRGGVTVNPVGSCDLLSTHAAQRCQLTGLSPVVFRQVNSCSNLSAADTFMQVLFAGHTLFPVLEDFSSL